MNDTIASMLKEFRKSSNLSVKQAASQLKHYGIDIASKTLYGYESGLSMPNADVFVALCNIYHCTSPASTILTTSQNQKESFTSPQASLPFSQDELSFLHDFQELDPFGQDIVRQIVAHEKERMKQMQK